MGKYILKKEDFAFDKIKELCDELVIVGIGYNSGGTNDNTSTNSAGNRAILMVKVSTSNPKCATKVKIIGEDIYTALYIPQNVKIFKARVNEGYQCVATVFDGTSYATKVFDTGWGNEVAINVSSYGEMWIALSARVSDNSDFPETFDSVSLGLQYFFI